MTQTQDPDASTPEETPKADVLTDIEKQINEKISAGDISAAKSLISVYGKKPNFIDDLGMTPLLNAAYKGQADMCRMLIDMVSLYLNCRWHLIKNYFKLDSSQRETFKNLI